MRSSAPEFERLNETLEEYPRIVGPRASLRMVLNGKGAVYAELTRKYSESFDRLVIEISMRDLDSVRQ